MKFMIKNSLKFILGLSILFTFYFISVFILSMTKIYIPPVILGLILFTVCLNRNIIKEDWVNLAVNFLLKYMPILFIPFIVGLIGYKTLILKNLFTIISVILITTTLTIVLTGLFVEYGIKYLRAYKIRRSND